MGGEKKGGGGWRGRRYLQIPLTFLGSGLRLLPEHVPKQVNLICQRDQRGQGSSEDVCGSI